MSVIPIKTSFRQAAGSLNAEAARAAARLRRAAAGARVGNLATGADLSQIVQSAAGRIRPADTLKLIDRGAGAVAGRLKFNHSFDDPAACEAAARRVKRCSATAGTLSGAAAGIGGIAALPADFTASLLIMSFTAHATGAAYGFSGDSPRDQLIRLHAIGLAAEASEIARRRRKGEVLGLLRGTGKPADIRSADVIQRLMQALLPGVMDNLLRSVAAKLGVRAVPAAGAAAGGLVGYRLQMRTSDAAAWVYSARWRIEGPGGQERAAAEREYSDTLSQTALLPQNQGSVSCIGGFPV